MDDTANLLLPFIMPSQAQKHVTHNEALTMLDALVMLSVVSRTETTPPGAPAEGECHIVGPDPTGGWSGKAGQVAGFQDGNWNYYPPREGWRAWCAAENCLLAFSGGAWNPLDPQRLAELGINAEADATNRLTVASDATLLTHETGSHRLVVNKATPADTASIVFQDNFSGRAEIGLAGNDGLSIKVSADGESWTEALTIDSATGKPSFPAANLLQDFAVNLYQDSGRFAGSGAKDVAIGSFAFPSYLAAYGGTTASALAKFITDNADYGGSGGTLDANVKDLIDMIRSPDFRRYGVEFWVAKLVMGTNTDFPLTLNGVTGYLSLLTANQLRPPKLTFHTYVRALAGQLLFSPQDGQTIFKNGVVQSGTFAILPTEGWVSITIHDSVDPYYSIGYQPSIFRIWPEHGATYLLACPALMGGIAGIDDTVGIIAASNSWPV